MKKVSKIIDHEYQPHLVEAEWYDWWENSNFFRSRDDDNREKYYMILPPPNITGDLHMGHALTCAIQDAMIRYHRMCGKNAHWIPGTDHAGIATQVVVERQLMATENKTRHDIGREAFTEKIYEWQNIKQANIKHQIKKIGASLDWSHDYFTMDKNFTNAVEHSFIKLFDDGLIYRANRIVNWCCTLQSTISDIEINYIDVKEKCKLSVPGYGRKIEFGVQIEFAYKVVDSDIELIIATTRIETMMGDTAVAIHSNDMRYKHLVGQHVIHPFRNDTIPIIIDDELVDPNFGTGVVKVTPAHDINDYECGKRNNLSYINILNDDGTFNDNAGQFSGMKRYEAKYEIIKQLKNMQLLRNEKSHPMRIGVCSRTGDVIEPIIKPQWWIRCDKLSKIARDAIIDKEITITPEKSNLSNWMNYANNMQDWCISRQLWWGHRVPVYNVIGTDIWIAADSKLSAGKKIKEIYPDHLEYELQQDCDVLDTWFSSALSPIAVFGWNNETTEFQNQQYPLNIMETGNDILFFWVMRMVMLCTYLTGKYPFTQIYLHTMVCDAYGKKMSKSSGNVIDPTDIINGTTLEKLHEKVLASSLSKDEKATAIRGQNKIFPAIVKECGADGLRFALLSSTFQSSNVCINVHKIITIRNFCNKIWNGVKFSLDCIYSLDEILITNESTNQEQWILHMLSILVTSCDELWKTYNLGKITELIQIFFVDHFCAFFLESVKPILKLQQINKIMSIRNTLLICIDTFLKLLHPIMPFITEELWQKLPIQKVTESIMMSSYPIPYQFDKYLNHEIYAEINIVIDIIHHIRSIIKRSHDYDIHCNIHCTDPMKINLQQYFPIILSICKISNVQVVDYMQSHIITDTSYSISVNYLPKIAL